MVRALFPGGAAALAAFSLVALAGCGGGGGGSAARCDGAAWTGSDPIGDRDGDGLANADECAAGLDPARADTDADGSPDGAEVANGTNPADADTDDDGLSDGDETSHGTDPKVADTDGDGLSDGDEVTGGLDPTVADTDGDGIADGEEAAYGTDPLSADSDGDGLRDGDEVALGYDPADPSDPPSDGVCGVLSACARDALAPVRWADRLSGDYRLALPGSAVVGEVSFAAVPAGKRAAAVGFDLRDDAVAGFLLSMTEPVGGGDPVAQLDALAARLAAATGAPWTGTELVAGRTTGSWDGFPAIVSARVNLAGASDVRAVRAAALAAMSGFPAATIGGLPDGAAFGAGTDFVLGLEVLSRRNARGDAARVVVVAAIAPKAAFDDRARRARLAVSDLSGGTALGQSGDHESTRCEHLEVRSEPRADFVWMSDISSSTNDERDPIAANASAVFGRLTELGVDFRMGVVKHTSNRRNTTTPGQLLGAGFTRSQGEFEAFWADTAGANGSEFGLTAVDDVIGAAGTAVPRTATEDARHVREGVKLVVVYVSDEHAQEVENACAEIADRNKALASGTEQSRAACIQQTIAPFVQSLQAEDAIAFGIIAPPPGGCATSYEVGWGYAEAIQATGGSYGSVCASDPGQTLDDIVSAVAGASSSMKLAGSPIALTLKVVVMPAGAVCDPGDPTAGQRELARSQVDGFDYDPVSNTIFFVGPSRPQLGDTVTVSYREWLDRTNDPDPDATDCCGGCTGRMWCDTSTCTCTSAG